MDIKFIGSGQSAKAILYYITGYVSKSQLKMHVIYNALEIAIRKLQTPILDVSGATERPVIDHACSMLRKAVNTIVSMQELSAQQVTLYSLRGADNYSSHSFRRLFWKHIELYVERALPLPATVNLSRPPSPTIDPASENVMSQDAFDIDASLPSHPDEHREDARVRVSLQDGLMIKGSQLADYVFCPIELSCLSLWDFVSHCEKRRLSIR